MLHFWYGVQDNGDSHENTWPARGSSIFGSGIGRYCFMTWLQEDFLRRTKRPAVAQEDGDIGRSGKPPRWGHSFLALLCVFAVAGCSSLPNSGPTESRIRKGAGIASPSSGVSYRLVPIDANTAKLNADLPNVGALQLAALSDNGIYARTDAIRIGDRLNFSIYEVGVSLFRSNLPAAPDPARTPSAGMQSIAVQVREDGTIALPYIGTLNVVGVYPDAVAQTVRQRLRPLSESPEVTVEIAETLENTVLIGGLVARSGRVRLTSARERVLDALALAGGVPLDVNEMQLTLTRGNKTVVVPLNQIGPGDTANIVLYPGDRIILERVRNTFTVFGASDRINQHGFDARSVSLAEAVARSGGPADTRANPRGVFVFRLEKDEEGKLMPTVYQLDMLKPESYFLAQLFPVRDKDVILIANSSSNLTQKLVNLVNQLFSPILAARVVAQ